MTDKDFLLKLASAELAYAANLHSAAKVNLENAAVIMDSAKKHLPGIWYSEKYYAKGKEIAS